MSTRPGWVRLVREHPGTTVHLVDLTHPDSPHRPGQIVVQRDASGEVAVARLQRWGTVCTVHDQCCPHERQDDARVSADDPADWCDGCRDARTS